MGLEKLNPFRTKSYGSGAWQGRTGDAAQNIVNNNEKNSHLAEIKGCGKCKKSGSAYQLCKKHSKPKYVKAAAKGF